MSRPATEEDILFLMEVYKWDYASIRGWDDEMIVRMVEFNRSLREPSRDAGQEDPEGS